jgi:ankyrin repeat protein
MTAAWRDAVGRGDADAVRALLRDGADVDARDRHGQTGLMLAAHAGHDAVIAVLLEHGAALDVTAKFGLSALMLAIVAGHPGTARLLARAGADRSLRGTGAPGFAGKTAYDLAVARDLHDLAADLSTPAIPGAGSSGGDRERR